jgi:predicted DNA-binding protein
MADTDRKNTGMRLTRTALGRIDRAAARLGRSRAWVVEVISVHADDLTTETLVPAGVLPPDGRGKKSRKKS